MSVGSMWNCLFALAAAGWLLVTPSLCAQTVEYIHTDALGTPIAVTNASRVVIERSEYEPYGKLLNRPLTDGPGFTGHVQDAATGMTYMQQRYYDPGIGRFLSVDPVTANSGTGANFNRYWYANNNPYRFTDPDGLTGLDYSSKYRDAYNACAQRTGCSPMDVPENIARAEKPYAEAAGSFLPVERAATGFLGILRVAQAARLTRLSVIAKLDKYLLNPAHAVGGAKAQWFEKALGFTRANMGGLAKQIVFDSKKAVTTGTTEFGRKYNQAITITGANGKQIEVTAAWIKSNKDDVVRLVTIIPGKK